MWDFGGGPPFNGQTPPTLQTLNRAKNNLYQRKIGTRVQVCDRFVKPSPYIMDEWRRHFGIQPAGFTDLAAYSVTASTLALRPHRLFRNQLV